MKSAKQSDLDWISGSRILVTGHTGFKGSWLCQWLHQQGAEVLGYSLPATSESGAFSLMHLKKKITHIEARLEDFNHLQEVMRTFRPRVVFHLAAQAIVRESYENPLVNFSSNLSGGVNLLEAVRQTDSVQALVFVTSDKCYLNKEWIWSYRENDELGGADPYSASKAAIELVFSSYAASFFAKRPNFGAATVRAGNVIGGGDVSRDRIVPDCLRALQEGRPITIRNPSSTRPWQHVLDPIYGYMKLAGALLQDPHRFNGAWNFGPPVESCIPVVDLARSITRHWGGGTINIQSTSNASHEAGLLMLNSDKAQQKLGWKASLAVDTACEYSVHWCKAAMEKKDLSDFTQEQIHNYQEVVHDRRG